MADIGDFFLGAASVERVGADVDEVVDAVVFVFVTVVTIDWRSSSTLDAKRTDVSATPNAVDFLTQQTA